MSIYSCKFTLPIKWFWLTNQMVLVKSTVLNWCKKIQTKKRFHISWVHVYENSTNVFNKVPIYPCKFTSTIKWFWFNSTVLNRCLKTLKNVKVFKQRNVSVFSWVYAYKNATYVFNKVPIYLYKFTSSIK